MGEPWVVKSNMVGNRPPCLGSPMSYLTVLLQGCYQVLERCKKTYFKAVLSTLESPQDSVSGRRQHRFDDRNARRCCGVGVRVSAPLRRGAAPYGDGSLCSQAPSHLISLSILGVLGLSSRLTWHDFVYVTMAQKVQASTLVYPWYPYPSFWERAGPHIPVAQDPPSEPRVAHA